MLGEDKTETCRLKLRTVWTQISNEGQEVGAVENEGVLTDEETNHQVDENND